MYPISPDYIDPALWRCGTDWVSTKSVWRKIRPLIVIRDDYTCQHCGFRSDKWQVVHHVNGDPNDMNPQNLKTVCIMCSMVLHSGLSSVIQGVVRLYARSHFDQNTITFFTRSLRGEGLPDKDIIRFLGLSERRPFRTSRQYLSGLFGFVSSKPTGTWQDLSLQYLYDVAREHGPHGIEGPLPQPDGFDFLTEVEKIKQRQPWYFPDSAPDMPHHEWLSLPPSETAPSQTQTTYWLSVKAANSQYPKATSFGGKWLVFVNCEFVDGVWATIRAALLEGKLGSSAKVSTAKQNPLSRDPRTHVICVYTYDWRDRKDVQRIANELRSLGVSWSMKYKTNEDTLSGRYSSTEPGPVTIYAQYGSSMVATVPGLQFNALSEGKELQVRILKFRAVTETRKGKCHANSLHFAGHDCEPEESPVDDGNALGTFMETLDGWAKKGHRNIVLSENLKSDLTILLREHADLWDDGDRGHVKLEWPTATLQVSTRGIWSGTVVFGQHRRVKLLQCATDHALRLADSDQAEMPDAARE